MEKVRSIYVAAVAVVLFLMILLFPGCAGSDDNSSGKGPTGIGGGALRAEAQPAALVSDLAAKHVSMALNQRREFEAFLDENEGCTLAAEYNAAVGQSNLSASTSFYCEYLRAQNIAVRDCYQAQEIANQIIEELRYFDRACASPHYANRRRGERRAKSLVKTALDYRAALGLPQPERLGFDYN